MRRATAQAAVKLFEFMTHDPLKVTAERYLNEATDRYDLEFRQRQIDKGRLRAF